ncbi:hypothetical protein K431DRAFT_345917 [Polychaeton citri CBS 116435]|uniref:Uncharacterized protein n=1 Tax=Polychaeton citri CBS 116435 TaxID=1314669 RepID=A0A9P4QBU4_9PEZI|nr:hypothetical protein K431DRAFT_345917 [Polychaeton citri CBS 116435]
MFFGALLISVSTIGTRGSSLKLSQSTSRLSYAQLLTGTHPSAPTISSALWRNSSQITARPSSESAFTSSCPWKDDRCLGICSQHTVDCAASWQSWSHHDVLWALTTETPALVEEITFGYSTLIQTSVDVRRVPGRTYSCRHAGSTGICTSNTYTYTAGTISDVYALGSATSTLTSSSLEDPVTTSAIVHTFKPPPSCNTSITCTTASNPADCRGCDVQGGTVELIYWADMATAKASNSSIAANTSTSVSTTVYKGHTLISPSILLQFKTAYALDNCGGTVGDTHPGAVITVHPKSLSSLVGSDDFYQVTMPDGVVTSYWNRHQFDFHNLVGLINAEVYNEMPNCYLDMDCYPIYPSSYHPVLFLPPEMRSLDPAWKTCGLSFWGAWDPPIALHPAGSAAMPTTSSMMPASTPASPQPTFQSPAQATSSMTSGHSTITPFPETEPDHASSQQSSIHSSLPQQSRSGGGSPSKSVYTSQTTSTTLQLLPPAPNGAPSASQTAPGAQAPSHPQSPGSGNGNGNGQNSDIIGVDPTRGSSGGNPSASQIAPNPQSSTQRESSTNYQGADPEQTNASDLSPTQAVPSLVASRQPQSSGSNQTPAPEAGNANDPNGPVASSAAQSEQQGQPSASLDGQPQESASLSSAGNVPVAQGTSQPQPDGGSNTPSPGSGSGTNDEGVSGADDTTTSELDPAMSKTKSGTNGNAFSPDPGMTTQTKGSEGLAGSDRPSYQPSATGQSPEPSSDSTPYSVVVENGHTISFISGGLAIDATTALVGGAPATISQVVYSAKSNGGLVIVSQNVVPVSQGSSGGSEGSRPTVEAADPQASRQGAAGGLTGPARTTIGGHAYTILQATASSGQSQSQPIIVKGADGTLTLEQGEVTTLPSGGEISVDANGQAVIEGHTIVPDERQPSGSLYSSLPEVTTVQPTLQATFAVGAKDLTAIVDPTKAGEVRVGGTTLSVGGEALTSGTHTISALSAGIINDGTMYLYTPEPTNSPASSVTTYASSLRRSGSRSSEALPEITSMSASYSSPGQTVVQSTAPSASSTLMPNLGARSHSGSGGTLSAILWTVLATLFL